MFTFNQKLQKEQKLIFEKLTNEKINLITKIQKTEQYFSPPNLDELTYTTILLKDLIFSQKCYDVMSYKKGFTIMEEWDNRV